MGFLGTLDRAFSGGSRSSIVFVEPGLVVYTNWKDERTARAVKIEPQSRQWGERLRSCIKGVSV
jgi:hypothetical protein